MTVFSDALTTTMMPLKATPTLYYVGVSLLTGWRIVSKLRPRGLHCNSTQ